MFGKSGGDKIKETARIETIIGAETIIQGTLSSKGSIRVDGKLEGGVAEAAAVVVGERGEIHGDVNARSAVIGGRVVGNIVTAGATEILAGAQIHGDIRTSVLSIAEGANFEGNCTMTKEKEVIEADVAAGSLKGRR
jgi:cytoskeletal protein CcmA (bactofilin family)